MFSLNEENGSDFCSGLYFMNRTVFLKVIQQHEKDFSKFELISYVEV